MQRNEQTQLIQHMIESMAPSTLASYAADLSNSMVELDAIETEALGTAISQLFGMIEFGRAIQMLAAAGADIENEIIKREIAR